MSPQLLSWRRGRAAPMVEKGRAALAAGRGAASEAEGRAALAAGEGRGSVAERRAVPGVEAERCMVVWVCSPSGGEGVPQACSRFAGPGLSAGRSRVCRPKPSLQAEAEFAGPSPSAGRGRGLAKGRDAGKSPLPQASSSAWGCSFEPALCLAPSSRGPLYIITKRRLARRMCKFRYLYPSTEAAPAAPEVRVAAGRGL